MWTILFPGCKTENLQNLVTPAQEMAGKKANPSEMVAELPLSSIGSWFHPNIYLKLLQSDFAPLLSEVLNLARLLAVLATMVRKSMKAHSSVTKWQGKKLWNHKKGINAWPKTMQISQWLYNWSKKLIYYLARNLDWAFEKDKWLLIHVNGDRLCKLYVVGVFSPKAMPLKIVL